MKLDQTCFRDIEFAYNAMKKWEPEAFIINDKAYMYGSKACGTNTTAIVTLNDTSDRSIYIDDIPRFLKAASHITSEKILVKFSPELERLFFCNCDTDEEQSSIHVYSRMSDEEMVGVESKTTDGLSPVTDDTPILIDFPYLRKIKKIIDITYMAGVFKIEKDTLF